MNENRRQFLTTVVSASALGVLGIAPSFGAISSSTSDDAAEKYLEGELRKFDELRVAPSQSRTFKYIRENDFHGNYGTSYGGRIVALEKGRYYEVVRPTLVRTEECQRGANMVLRGFLDGKPWMRWLDDLDKCIIEKFRPVLGTPRPATLCMLHLAGITGIAVTYNNFTCADKNTFTMTPLRIPDHCTIVSRGFATEFVNPVK